MHALAPAVQGYGLTETCAASFISNAFDNEHLGTVGAPLAHTDLQLEAVPEMGCVRACAPLLLQHTRSYAQHVTHVTCTLTHMHAKVCQHNVQYVSCSVCSMQTYTHA